MSTTVSMGVWSVTVMGAMSRIMCSMSGGGAGVAGAKPFPANTARDWEVTPSTVRRPFAGIGDWLLVRGVILMLFRYNLVLGSSKQH